MFTADQRWCEPTTGVRISNISSSTKASAGPWSIAYGENCRRRLIAQPNMTCQLSWVADPPPVTPHVHTHDTGSKITAPCCTSLTLSCCCCSCCCVACHKYVERGGQQRQSSVTRTTHRWHTLQFWRLWATLSASDAMYMNPALALPALGMPQRLPGQSSDLMIPVHLH
jgi:hypothetical protein